MSVIGLRVGPFEIVEPAVVPVSGDWYRARRAGMTRRQPEEVLVRLLPSDADGASRASLQTAFHNLRAVEDTRIPSAVALYEGIGALAVDAPDGASLADVIEARGKGTIALTPATLLDVALEVAETLQHAHHRNRFHGHLEPASVRITSTGKLFLFGFEEPEARPSSAWLTPEHARGEGVGAPADQWGLAAILSGLIAGVKPWDDGEIAAVGNAEHLVDPIEQQWPALARLLRRMLESDPANRHSTMHPVRQELLALARKAGGTSERLELGRAMARRLGRRTDVLVEGPTEKVTHVAPSAGSDTSAETLVEPRPEPQTEESMNLPEPGVEPPPIVERVEPVERAPTPLVDEPVAVVAPQITPQQVPQLSREGDEVGGINPAALAPLERLAPADLDDDGFDDVPTERISSRSAMAAMFESDTGGEDFGLPDGFEDDGFVSALAIAPGDGPTAVPFTDPGVPSEAPTVPALPIVPSEPTAAPIVSPVGPVEVAEIAAPTPAPSGRGISIQKVVPVLIGVMLLLMVGSLLWMM